MAPIPASIFERIPELSEDELAEQLVAIIRAEILQDFPDFRSTDAQPVHVFPLNLSGSMHEYWVAVTDGPQPARVTSSDEVINFFHIVVAFRLCTRSRVVGDRPARNRVGASANVAPVVANRLAAVQRRSNGVDCREGQHRRPCRHP